jgi:Flp pilus assembly protein TadG
MLRRLRTASGGGGDTGAVTILFAVGIAAIMMIIALSADISGSLRNSFRARALAEQAARAGADQISIGAALAGDGTKINQDNRDQAVKAAACAPDALPKDAQCDGDPTVTNTSVTVTITLTYSSMLNQMFGSAVPNPTVTGTATAVLVQSTPP